MIGINKMMIVDKLKKHQNIVIAAFIGFLVPKILQRCTIALRNSFNTHQETKRIYVGI